MVLVKARIDPDESGILARATVQASDRLGVKGNVLASIIGVSEPTISRMRTGEFKLARGRKEFELAALFLRMYRSLDAIVGGDDALASQWLKNHNTALGDKPIMMIQSAQGLVDVIHYLDSRRAPI
jgi:hypothetical protein